MAKSKRSSLRADPFYLKAFRVRASSDASKGVIEQVASVDGTATAIESSPAPDRTTIKLVQPSPPQSSTSTIASRSASAASQAQKQETTMAKESTNINAKYEIDERKLDTTPKKQQNLSNESNSTQLPIYDQFTPSQRSSSHYDDNHSTLGSPSLSPATAANNRAPSPLGGSEDGNHLPIYLRSSSSMGKSGRVIEKITSENSRLLRELNEKTARLEEAQRTHTTDRIAVQEAKESAMRHQHLYESSAAILARRDRKVEELKESLAGEKARREKAEKERQDMAQVLQAETTKTAQQLAIEQEKRLHYQVQYEVLQQEFKKGMQPWQPQVDQLRTKMDDVGSTLHRLSQNQEKISLHQSQADEIHKQYVVKFEEYKKANEDLLGPVTEKIKENETAADNLLMDMEATLHKMRWVINVSKNVKGAQ